MHKGGIDSLALIVTSMPWERLAAAVVPDQLLVEADGLRLFQGLAAGIEKVSELLRLYGCRTMQGGCTVVCRKWKRLFRSG
ncbi:hypothetical protein [Salibacterium halotolerans]|uniref:hypothetical protein n=1 Tax=Salibacterium halotolerans TaxID=1884432 RepID=UPI00147BC6F5|nr:hypothetical protein [Salibacterium halotolerans]